MSDEMKIQVHNILYKYCSDFLNVQEITHAANEIVNNPTENTVLEMTTYLDSFDTMRNGSQSILQPTSNVKAFTANNVRFAMSEIRKLIASNSSSSFSLDDSLFTNIVKAPIHDASNTIPDNEVVTGYNISVGTITQGSADNVKVIPITFSGTVKQHQNEAGQDGYWMGIALKDTIMVDGCTVKFKRGFGTTYDISSGFEDVDSSFFETDSNISSSGKWCSFYREVSSAKSNQNHAYVILSLTKNNDTLYYVYDYNYTNVVLGE